MGPLAGIINSIPQLATSFTSMGRIQTFLNGKERSDNRIAMQGHGDTPRSSCDKVTHIPEPEGEKESTGTWQNDTIASLSGSFSWKEDADPVINIPFWSIKRRDFTLVLGPVGCGKSTLLKALLGELSSFKGYIRIAYSAVSYCGQSPWLPNETIRSIIIGATQVDESWYREVTKACALDVDMRTWPKGDETLVGTKGISMSGGQKHRLVSRSKIHPASQESFSLTDEVFGTRTILKKGAYHFG